MKVDTYTIKGTKTGETTLPKEFDVKANAGLLAQAVRIYQERSHVGLRNTQTRSEVNRTTKKLYKQKGTGGARHGSRRANLFVGGGVTFGPRPERRVLELPVKVKSKAKFVAFAAKANDKKLVVLTDLNKVEKTKSAAEFLKKLGAELKTNKFVFAVSDKNAGVGKFLRNLGNAYGILYRDINAFDVYKGGVVVLDSEIFAVEKAVKAEKVTKPASVKTTARQGKTTK